MTKIRRSKTLQVLALEKIKRLIVTGKLKNEEIYSANHFGELLGISRTPAREALLQLESDGYLVSLRGRGFKLRHFSKKEIRDFFDMRKMIEMYIVRNLSGKMTAASFDKLKEIHAKMSVTSSGNDAFDFLELDRTFHINLINLYGNDRISETMETIRNLMMIMGERAMVAAGRFKDVIAEHGSILESLAQKDISGAVEAMCYHIEATEKHVMQQYF